MTQTAPGAKVAGEVPAITEEHGNIQQEGKNESVPGQTRCCQCSEGQGRRAEVRLGPTLLPTHDPHGKQKEEQATRAV